MNDIKQLQDDTEDIYTTGLIKRYTTRPPHLEQCTLADYAAWYDSSKQYVKQSIQTDTDNLPLETGNNDENDDDSEIKNRSTMRTCVGFHSNLIRFDIFFVLFCCHSVHFVQ